MKDEFYIGWQDKAAPGIGRTVRRTVVGLLLLALLAAAALAFAQRLIGTAVFEWGNAKNFSGVIQAQPYPRLLIAQTNGAGFATYHLVAPWKFGLKPEAVAAFDGQAVTLKGTLIYRDNQRMIEVADGSLRLAETNSAVPPVPEIIPLGRQTLAGEIVDSKCFLGVMNPGQLAPHRACAIRCISGGVPPVLVVPRKNGPTAYLLLVSTAGKPVNREVLDFVAEPLEITGEVERQGDQLVLRADPATYRRR